MVLETRFYDILLVRENASIEEISKAYKKIALTCHPDKTGRDPALTEKFKDVTRAYEVLKDARARLVYDHYGEAGLDGSAADEVEKKQHQQGRTTQQQQPHPPCNIRRATDLFSQVFSDFHQAFNPMGGALNMHMNMMNMMGCQQPPTQQQAQQNTAQQFQQYQQQFLGNSEPKMVNVTPVENPNKNNPVRGRDIHHVCNVTLADLYYGKVVKFRLPKNSACKTCNAVGGKNPKLCKTCAGQGQVLISMINQNSQYQELSLCKDCLGTGVYISPLDKCPANCVQGYLKESKIIKANIFPGSNHNDKIVLQGEGDEGRNIVPGDVIIQLQQIAHPSIVRSQNDLFMEQDIDLKTALCGGKIIIQDYVKPGQSIEINVNVHGYDSDSNTGEIIGVIQNGTPKIVKNFGMPINETSIEGAYFQNSKEADDFSDVIFDLKRYRRGNLFIKFNVRLPTLEDFSGEEDFNLLKKVLPNTIQLTNITTDLKGQLSNIPEVGSQGSQKKKLKKSTSFSSKRDKYDYNDIDIGESEEDDEKEDEVYYTNEWDDGRKRKARMNGMSDFVTT